MVTETASRGSSLPFKTCAHAVVGCKVISLITFSKTFSRCSLVVALCSALPHIITFLKGSESGLLDGMDRTGSDYFTERTPAAQKKRVGLLGEKQCSRLLHQGPQTPHAPESAWEGAAALCQAETEHPHAKCPSGTRPVSVGRNTKLSTERPRSRDDQADLGFASVSVTWWVEIPCSGRSV